MGNRRGFTLAELLVVVGILLIAWYVVLFLLNPVQLYFQGNDGNRVAALNSLDKAVSLYYSDAVNNPTTFFMGTSSIIYLSLPDPTATTTAGTNCSGLGFANFGSINYHCPASSTYIKADGTGWLPINFGSFSAGNPLSALPIDPTNTTSSGEFYAYVTDGQGGYEIIGRPESKKYASASSTADFIKGTGLAALSALPTPGALTFSSSSFVAGSTPYFLTFDSNTNTVWVTLQNAPAVTMFNDTAPYATTTFPTTMAHPSGIAFDSHTNTVWVGGDTGGVTIFNDTPPYATTTFSANVGSINFSNVVFDPHTNTVWMTNPQLGFVTIFNDTPPYATTTVSTGVVGGLAGLAFDSHTNTMWTTDGSSKAFQIIDTPPYTTSSVSIAGFPTSVAFNSHTNTIWATENTGNVVAQINDTSPYAVTTITVSAPQDLVFDPHTYYMWISKATGADYVVQMNDITYATTTLGKFAGTQPLHLLYDPHTNAVWGANNTSNVGVVTPNH